MGISLSSNPPYRMVAAQVYIALCVASLTVAAPQLNFAGPRSVSTARGVVTSTNINQEKVVTDVVTALQPSIAKAVADALAALQTSTFTSSLSSTSAADAERAAFEAEVAADVGLTARPVYNYEYKVADVEAQTYISQSENRDGESLTGTYSYVNPTGALVTVNYEAGPDGFTQTVDQQEGFVTIRAKPVRTTATAGSGVRGRSGAVSRFSGSTSSSSSVDQSALIAQIIAALQPQISSAVQSAISSSRTTSTVAQVPILGVAPPRRIAPVATSSGDLSSTFGEGISVKIDTPEFNIAY